MRVALRHPGTGRFRFVGTGWSWPIFLGAGFLGLPLFFRGLALWGVIMVLLWFLDLAVQFATTSSGEALSWLLNLAIVGLCLFLGFRGNALSARHFVACGYDFARPDSSEARIATRSWGL